MIPFPLSDTANFTSYAIGGFDANAQAELVTRSERAAFKRDIPVLISNHDTPLTQKLYDNADCSYVNVARNISQDGKNRNKVSEVFAYYQVST